MRNTHVPPGVWRGVNVNQNAIFIECFMDELAQAVGQDELEFRRKLMKNHPRNLAVLNAVAERIGWGKPAPQGVYRGLAHMKAFNAYVAGAAEVSVANGKIKVHRIVGASDCTHAVNPAQIDRQVAGSFVYGLSALFYQECTVKNGRIEQTNFDTYNSMRIAEMPKVEVDRHRVRGREPLGWHRRADHLRGGTRGDERVLQGDGPAHPLVPAEEPQYRHGLTPSGRRRSTAADPNRTPSRHRRGGVRHSARDAGWCGASM